MHVTQAITEKIGGFAGVHIGMHASGDGQTNSVPADFGSNTAQCKTNDKNTMNSQINGEMKMTKFVTFTAIFALSLPLVACRSVNSKSSVNGSGAYATGHYRNLFAEDGHSPQEIQNKIDSAFEQLFHGNPTNQAVFYYAGSNSNGLLAYVTDIKHHDVRTEGLSYGMMIAVEMNKKKEFDALWNWSKTYLYHSSPTDPSYGFFSWEAKTDGGVMSQFVAPDGESYYVMALYFAANRWGSGKGISGILLGSNLKER